MNMKNMIRKVAAVGAGATMVGATLMGALASSLADYPAPFVSDGAFDAVLIVGDNAAAADIIGVTDIAMALQFSMKTTEEVEVETTLEVTGGELVEDQALNSAFTAANYTDSDVAALLDTQIDWNDLDIDVYEQIGILGSALELTTSTGASGEKEFEDSIYMTLTDADGVYYRYHFEDNVNMSDIGITPTTDELEISFLGESVEITSLSATSMKISSSEEHYMGVGDSVTIDGKIVTLINVGSTSAVVQVGGQTKTITATEGATTFDNEGDFKVDVESVFYVDEQAERSATLTMGDDLTTTVSKLDSVELFGEPEDEDDAEWVWDWGTTGDMVNWIGVEGNQKREHLDRTFAPLSEGGSIDFPNDYAAIEFKDLDSWAEQRFTVSFEDSFQFNTTLPYDDQNVLEFTTDGAVDSKPFWSGSNDYNKILIAIDNSGTDNVSEADVWYKDGNDDWINSGNNYFTIKIKTDVWTVNASTPGQINIHSSSAVSQLKFNATYTEDTTTSGYHTGVGYNYFGTADGEDTNDYFEADGNDYTTRDEDILTDYGFRISDPEGALDAESLVFYIPKERVNGALLISASGTETTTSGSVTTETVTQIEVGATKLASEVADVTAQNAIVVGGPCANSAAASLMGNPSPCYAGFTEGEAMVKLYENGGNVALLVAGATADDTRTAAKLVANGAISAVDGMEAVVTTLTESVTAPVAAAAEEAEEAEESEEAAE